jgi:hypothetical protein
MAGIARGFLGEGIVRDDALPLLGRADEEIRFKAEACSGRFLQQAFQPSGRSTVHAENKIPALQERPDVPEAEVREEIAQVRHGDRLAAADIDASEQGDVDHESAS